MTIKITHVTRVGTVDSACRAKDSTLPPPPFRHFP